MGDLCQEHRSTISRSIPNCSKKSRPRPLRLIQDWLDNRSASVYVFYHPNTCLLICNQLIPEKITNLLEYFVLKLYVAF
jgi:hypothetical protein